MSAALQASGPLRGALRARHARRAGLARARRRRSAVAVLARAARPGGDGGFQSVLVAAAEATEPVAQLAVDDVLSLLEIGIAVALAVVGTWIWSVRLLALGLVGAAGAFNLQSDAVATVLAQSTGVPLDVLSGITLHSVAVVAFIAALLLFPAPDPAVWWHERAATPRGRVELAAVGGLLVVVGISAPGAAERRQLRAVPRLRSARPRRRRAAADGAARLDLRPPFAGPAAARGADRGAHHQLRAGDRHARAVAARRPGPGAGRRGHR